MPSNSTTHYAHAAFHRGERSTKPAVRIPLCRGVWVDENRRVQSVAGEVTETPTSAVIRIEPSDTPPDIPGARLKAWDNGYRIIRKLELHPCVVRRIPQARQQAVSALIAPLAVTGADEWGVSIEAPSGEWCVKYVEDFGSVINKPDRGLPVNGVWQDYAEDRGWFDTDPLTDQERSELDILTRCCRDILALQTCRSADGDGYEEGQAQRRYAKRRLGMTIDKWVQRLALDLPDDVIAWRWQYRRPGSNDATLEITVPRRAPIRPDADAATWDEDMANWQNPADDPHMTFWIHLVPRGHWCPVPVDYGSPYLSQFFDIRLDIPGRKLAVKWQEAAS